MLELKNYSEAALRELADQILVDLEKAAIRDENYDAEWHESCFAAILAVGNELLARSLKEQYLH